MNKKILVIMYGVGVWALPFIIGMTLFPIQGKYPDIFDSAMKLFLLLATVFFTGRYLSTAADTSFNNLVLVGFAWVAVCLAIDLPLFLMAFGFSLEQYAMDIPLGYLLIPLATGGMAKAFAIGVKRGN